MKQRGNMWLLCDLYLSLSRKVERAICAAHCSRVRGCRLFSELFSPFARSFVHPLRQRRSRRGSRGSSHCTAAAAAATRPSLARCVSLARLGSRPRFSRYHHRCSCRCHCSCGFSLSPRAAKRNNNSNNKALRLGDSLCRGQRCIATGLPASRTTKLACRPPPP